MLKIVYVFINIDLAASERIEVIVRTVVMPNGRVYLFFGVFSHSRIIAYASRLAGKKANKSCAKSIG